MSGMTTEIKGEWETDKEVKKFYEILVSFGK